MKIKISRSLMINIIPFLIIQVIIFIYSIITLIIFNPFFIIFFSFIIVANYYFIEKKTRKGKDFLYDMIKYQEDLKEKYGESIKKDLREIFYIIRNKSLFNFFNIELFIASLKYNLELKPKFITKEKGWRNNFYSTKKGIFRYSLIYQEIYEGQLLFLITYLMTILAIKNDHLFNIIEGLMGRADIKVNLKTQKEIVPVLQKIIINKEKELFCTILKNATSNHSLLNYKYNNPTDKNLNKFKHKIIRYLTTIGLDPVLTNAISKLSLEKVSEMKKYRSYFRNKLYSKDCSLNVKLNFLKSNGYDFSNWIEPILRNKFVHHLNISTVKLDDKTCGIKIIFGKNKNDIITINDYYDNLCKLYALTNFLFNHLFRSEDMHLVDYYHFKVSNKKILKALKNPNLIFP